MYPSPHLQWSIHEMAGSHPNPWHHCRDCCLCFHLQLDLLLWYPFHSFHGQRMSVWVWSLVPTDAATWYQAKSNNCLPLHRQLKASLKSHSNPVNCMDALPMVLLGICSTLKEDIHCTAAELVYKNTLHLPGEIFNSDSQETTADPTSYVQRLRTTMQQLRHPQFVLINARLTSLTAFALTTCLCPPWCHPEPTSASPQWPTQSSLSLGQALHARHSKYQENHLPGLSQTSPLGIHHHSSRYYTTTITHHINHTPHLAYGLPTNSTSNNRFRMTCLLARSVSLLNTGPLTHWGENAIAWYPKCTRNVPYPVHLRTQDSWYFGDISCIFGRATIEYNFLYCTKLWYFGCFHKICRKHHIFCTGFPVQVRAIIYYNNGCSINMHNNW